MKRHLLQVKIIEIIGVRIIGVRVKLNLVSCLFYSDFNYFSDPNYLGGQQQRVAIARAIVTQPLLLLADEPTGNLDTQRSEEIMELLTAFNRDNGITVVMITHEADMAVYARRVVHFRDGLIESDGLQSGSSVC